MSFGYCLTVKTFNGQPKICLVEEFNGVETVLAVCRGEHFDGVVLPQVLIAGAKPCDIIMEALPTCCIQMPVVRN